MKMCISAKAAWAKVLACVIVLSVGSAFAACAQKPKVPTKEKFLQSSEDDPDRHRMRDFDFTRSDLLKAWGDPTIGGSDSPTAVWECGDKYIVVDFSADDPEKIESMYASFTQDLVVLFSYTEVIYVSTRDDDVTDTTSCIGLSDSWLSEEDLSKIEPGTILRIEFDGWFMETYPAQISKPYSAKIIGRVPDSEMAAIEAHAQDIRERFTDLEELSV